VTETNEIVTVLTEEDGWDFLRRHEFGRLAYRVGNATDIAPVNYVVDGSRVVFLTSQGSKLAGVAITQDVAFEVDHIEQDHATSVVAHGLARHLRGAEAERAAKLPIRAWVPTEKHEYVAIEITRLAARRFVLRREVMATDSTASLD